MDKVDLLFQHYNDTFSIQKEQIESRNRYFVFLFLTICIQFLFALSPDSISAIFVALVLQAYNIDVSAQINIVQSALWIVMFYLTMRYFQTNIFVERQYQYIGNMEHQLSELSSVCIDREGKSYLKHYPLISDFIDFIYKWFFPIFYIIVICTKLISEYIYHTPVGFHIINTILCGLCVSLTILYLLFLHTRKKER